MAKEKHILKSKRLLIKPANPDDLFDSPWDIFLKNDPERKLGWISFEGEKANGVIPISIELDDNYRNQGYGTEAIKLMTDFAFLFKPIYEIQTDTVPENDAYIYALEKAGYVIRSANKKNEHYSIVKPKPVWTGLYIFIGVIAGCMLGIVFENMWLGMAAGVMLGIIIGALLDIGENKERTETLGHKEEKRRQLNK